MLLNRSREYIAKTMEMLSRINAPSDTYAASGAQQGANATIAVDRRV
jgi:hypothetical protein